MSIIFIGHQIFAFREPEKHLYCGLSNVCIDKFKLEAAHKLGEKLANELIKLGGKTIIDDAKISLDKS